MWILTIALLGFLSMYLSTFFTWGLNLFSLSIFAVFIWLLPEKSKDDIENIASEINEARYEMFFGINDHQRFNKIGLWLFFISGIAGWVVFYATIVK